MPRAQTKNDLLADASSKYLKMWSLIDNMSEETRTTSFDFSDNPKRKEAHWKRDENLKDVLIHLYEWHQLLLQWVSENKKGNDHTFLPKPYNWKTYGEMNIAFKLQHTATDYEEAKVLLEKSHFAVLSLIESMTNDELFTKGFYDWAGTTTVGSYCVSATASHYDWAMKKIRAHIKVIGD